MDRILVLGGSGFIAEPLVRALREAGENVVAPLREELDIATEPEKLVELLKEHDTLVILTPPNEQGIKNISSALALSKIRHVLYVSTALVYGSSEEPQREDVPLAPSSDYARGKLTEEETLRQSNVPLTIVRLGNVYGGPKNKGIVQKAIEALQQGKPLLASGETQVRDFIHVDDVVAAIEALLEVSPEQYQIVNVMTGKGTAIGDMFGMLERLTDKKILKIPGVEGKEMNIIGNMETLRDLTGSSPRISLEEGLRKTLHAYDRSIQK